MLTCKTSPVPVFPGRLPGRGNPKRRELVPERVLRGIAGAEVQRGCGVCYWGVGVGTGQDPGIQGLRGGRVCVEGTGEPEMRQDCVFK